jgi:hypothetical protein
MPLAAGCRSFKIPIFGVPVKREGEFMGRVRRLRSSRGRSRSDRSRVDLGRTDTAHEFMSKQKLSLKALAGFEA